MGNPWDGGAAQVVPTNVERMPLFHWRPGARVLVVGSRDGASFDGEVERHERGTFQRPLDRALLREALRASRCDAVGAAWSASLRHPVGMGRLVELAADAAVPLLVQTPGHGDPASLDRLLPVVAAWQLLADARPGPLCAAILAGGRHVEILVGLDSGPLPALDWTRASAVHLVPRHAAAGDERDALVASARAALPAETVIYDERHRHSDCRSCGARLVWRAGGRSRVEGLDAAGACTRCGAASGIRRA